MTRTVYIAAPYACKPLARAIRHHLLEHGLFCNSSWIDGGTDDWPAEAERDLQEVREADWLVAYVPTPDPSTGGRDCELGMALAFDKMCFVVGRQLNVFHRHPAVVHFESILSFVRYLDVLPDIKDSGQRQEFQTGSVRDNEEGKGWYAHLSPIAIERLAKLLEAGGRKYGSRNWEKGQPLARFAESALRHLFKYLEGHRDEDHLAAAAWNIQGLIHVEEMVRRGKLPAELDDLPNYVD